MLVVGIKIQETRQNTHIPHHNELLFPNKNYSILIVEYLYPGREIIDTT